MQEEENNGFGPFLVKRGSGAKWVAVAFLVLFVVSTFLLENSGQPNVWPFYFFAFVFSLLAWMMGELARRLCLFCEEIRHRRPRYGGSITKAFKASFDHQNNQLAVLMFTISLCLVAYKIAVEDLWSSYRPEFIRLFGLNGLFVPIFVYLFGLRELSRVEYSQVNEKENKNLADGLAWSYYFGYLKFVLPALENQINLTTKYRYMNVPRKVFIIIPKSCQVFDTISNKLSDPNNLVKIDGNLEPLKKSRGGIQHRIYKHTVHSIKDEDTGKTHYCIMEYATPLMTLFDMTNDPNAGLSREERDSQVNLFVAKLREILDNNRECKDKYKLVTFGGEDQDIGKIIIRALKDPLLEFDDK